MRDFGIICGWKMVSCRGSAIFGTASAGVNAFTTASTWANDTMLGMNGEGAVQKGGVYGGFLNNAG